MEVPIVFEDDYLIVVDKPAGLVVNRAESVKEKTLTDWAQTKIKNLKLKVKNEEEYDFYKRAGIVHRLDKETSGLLAIAKEPRIFLDLQRQFAQRLVTKKYLALVHGKVSIREGEIRAEIGRLPWNREKFGVIVGGRLSITTYKIIDYYQSADSIYSFLEVIPQTGRTHQIRVHLKYFGYSIVSDKLYAGRKLYKLDLKFCPRLFLHAFSLEFCHPVTQKKIEFMINLAQDLQKSLGRLQKVK